MGKTFISYGDYEQLVPKLKLVKPVLVKITDRYTEKMNKLLNRKKHSTNLTISMDKPVYQTKEGDAAFLTCSVYPKPDQIVWKKDKTAKPSEIVPIDNRKYFYGIEAPTLVIKDPYKIYDEAHYQCTAKAHRKTIDGQVVQLQVTAVTDLCRTTSAMGPSDVMSQSTTRLEDLNADIRHR
ncbi:uncharacterized protein [Argopecten irradians]|uniref:uncharacterized protein n=1 Tax=Argopecten irradians TaxID=31199 RepID=UPI00371012E9